MTTNKLITILIAAVIFLGIYAGRQAVQAKQYERELEITKRSLLKKDRELIDRIDDLKSLQQQVAAREQYWMGRYEATKDSLNLANRKTKQWQIEYEKLKNRPVPHWSARDLDTLIESIIR